MARSGSSHVYYKSGMSRLNANRPPVTATIMRVLILLNAVFWLVFAALAALGVIQGIPAGWMR
jgi:hypothetical protein